jgi:hypothetical protein
MPIVKAPPRSLQDGSTVTQFTNTTNTTSTTYTYPTTQTNLIVENSGEHDIYLTVGTVNNQLIKVDTKYQYDGQFTEFSIRSDIDSQEFIATAYYQEYTDFNSLNDQLNTVTTQLAHILNQQFVNVKHFGAKGDDLTDDTQAIQAALDSVQNTGGVVFFPKGVYRISQNFTCYNLDGYSNPTMEYRACLVVKGNNVTLKGEGIGNTIIKMYPSNYRTLGTITGQLSNLFLLQCGIDVPYTNQSNITFDGIEMDGGRGEWNQAVLDKNYTIDGGGMFENGANNGKGINANTNVGDLTNLRVINCKIANTYAEGMYSNKAKDSYVENCILSYCRPAAGNLSGSVTYKKCSFSKMYSFSIEHFSGNGRNYLKVIDCEFHDLDTLSQIHITSFNNPILEAGSKAEFIGNTFFYDDPLVTNRYVGSIKADGYETVIIEKNTMLQKTNEGTSIFPIEVDNSKHLFIEKNRINQNGSTAYKILNTGQSNSNILIKNNVRNFVSGTQRAFPIDTITNIFGSMPSFIYEDNDLIFDGDSGNVTTTANNDTSLGIHIEYNYIGKSKLLLSFSADTTINKLYYYAPSGYGGDGIQNNIISSPMTIKAGTLYSFDIIHPLVGANLSNKTGGFSIGVTTTDAVTVNYRFKC